MADTTLLDLFNIAAPSGVGARRQSGSASALSPRRGAGSGPPRRASSRWSRVRASLVGRDQRVSFASRSSWMVRAGRESFAPSSPKPHCSDEGALTYPSQMAALGRVVASTRGVLAAQAHVAAHKAARSHPH